MPRQKPKDPDSKRQPAALKVDLTETIPKHTGNWETNATDKEGNDDSKRRSSRTSTSGASVGHGETQFGPDELFDQDHVSSHPECTPPPRGIKKLTLKSMKQKVAKSVGLPKSSSKNPTSHEGETEQIENLKEELEVFKLQAQQYKKDFEEEREARANAVGARDSDFGKFSLEIQELNDELAQTKQSAETEKAEKQAVIATLESTVKELQQTQRQSDQADKDYQDALKMKNDDLAKLANEKRELMGQMEHFRNLSQEYEQQFEMAKLKYQQRQAELEIIIQALVSNQLQRTLWLLDTQLKHAQVHLQPKQPVSPSYNEGALDRYIVQPRQPIKFDVKIGEGCYGSVYAINLNGTLCIAKRLQDILMGRNREEAVSQKTKDGFHRNFFRECVLLSQTNHPNIVKFIGVLYGRDKYDLTLILERLATDLKNFLKKDAHISFPTKVAILHDVSCGLVHLHERCIIHRDLSAGNILLTNDSRAKIADLGVSRIFDRSLTQLTKAPGSQAYMSPEALRNEKYDEGLDIFSFGVIALYTAVQEFPEFSWARVPEDIHLKGEGEIFKRRSWMDVMTTRQPELSSLVLWCLRDDPMKRPTTFTLNTLLNEMKKDYSN